MIYCKLRGGLGNQMFQYAAAYSLSKSKGTSILVDSLEFKKTSFNLELTVFNQLQLTFSNKLDCYIQFPMAFVPGLRKLFKKITPKIAADKRKYFYEYKFSYINEIDHAPKTCYLDGYWQSYKYLKNHEQDIREIYTFSKPEDPNNLDFLKQIHESNSVSIHIRRGDYLKPGIKEVHGNLGLEYYQAAIDAINSKVQSSKFFIFSNDINWVKKSLDFGTDQVVYIDNNNPGHLDMYLMSQCKNNIMANSSFSWWGAWLNQNPSKVVIAPQKWFATPNKDTQDLCPTNWIRI